MLAAPGPAQPAGQPGPPPVAPVGALQPYRALYYNAAVCPFGNNYAGIYAEWSTPEGAQPRNTPIELRTKVYSNAMGVQGKAMAHVLLVRPATANADDPGLVQGYHRISRYTPMIGEVTGLDNVGFAFLGDVYGGSPPATVVIDNDLFNRCASVRVKTPLALDQHLAAHPNDEFLMGPFDAAEPDTEPITTRLAMFIPNKYVTLVMEQGLKPREAWLRIRTAIVAAGEEAELLPLINWLRVALTRPAANALPRQCVAPPVSQLLATPLDAARFNAFRQKVIEHDLPQLANHAVTAGANQIALGLNQLVTEQRQARIDEETRRQRDKNRTPTDLYGEGGVLKLLRWCGVADETALPPVHLALANSGRGKNGGMTHRRALQVAVDAAAEVLELTDLDLLITPSVATRIVNLAWASSTPDNLAVGLHPFAVGYMSDDDLELQRLLNEEADLLYSGDAAPSLQDAQSVVTSDKDVHIPKSLVQARLTLQRALLLFAVLLGDDHRLVKEYQDYLVKFQQMETRLETAKPRNPRHAHLVPALLVRRVQLETNEWLRDQSLSPNPLPVIRMLDVFREIALRRDWAPDLPDTYLHTTPLPVSNTTTHTVVSELTTPTIAHQVARTATTIATQNSSNTMGPPSSSPKTASQPKNNPNFNAATFDTFRNKNLVTKRVKAYCQANNVPLPINRDNKVMCLAWHLKGHCNEACGSRHDHRPHDQSEDATLLTWAQAHYKTS